MGNPFAYTSAREIARQVREGEVSACEVVNSTLEYAEEVNASLNCFSVIDREGSLREAKAIDRAYQRGDALGALAGVPVSVKDLIPVRDLRLTYGSRLYSNHVAHEEAVSVERLRQAGACIVGMTTTSEFGAKGVGDNPLHGVTRNPWNADFTPGGSSAGAGAGVAAGVTPIALGTDGGGSLRIPAAFCGLVGVKAQFGRVPLVPATGTPTLSHIGPLARKLDDAGLVLTVVAGYDSRDPGSVKSAMPDVFEAMNSGLAGIKVGVSTDLGYATPDEDILLAVDSAVSVLRDRGADISIINEVLDDPFDIWKMEFYTGIAARQKEYLARSSGDIDPVVYRELVEALQYTAVKYQEALFRRSSVRRQMRTLFEDIDVLISPTTPVSRIRVGHSVPDGYAGQPALHWSSYTYPFNLTGQPALSIPCGFDQMGMPVGVQVVSDSYREDDLFKVAAVLEDHYRFYEKRPWEFVNN